MSKTVPFLFVDGELTVVLNGVSHVLNDEHPKYKAVREGLKTLSADELLELVNYKEEEVVVESTPKPTLKDENLGVVVVSNGRVTYNGEEVSYVLSEKIAELQHNDLPLEGMVNFISRLYKGMSYRNRNELLSFVERNGLTIDSDGFLLAYKAVRNDYVDKYSGTIDNSPGNTIEMPREKVDDDFRSHCSKGLHAGALEYIYKYGHGSDRIVIVKIDPADVISVPDDHNCQKLRTCKYVVVGDYEGKLKQTVYDAEASVEDMYDEDEDVYDDEEDNFDWDSVNEDYDEDDEDEDDYDEDDSFDEGDVTVTPQKGIFRFW